MEHDPPARDDGDPPPFGSRSPTYTSEFPSGVWTGNLEYFPRDISRLGSLTSTCLPSSDQASRFAMPHHGALPPCASPVMTENPITPVAHPDRIVHVLLLDALVWV